MHIAMFDYRMQNGEKSVKNGQAKHIIMKARFVPQPAKFNAPITGDAGIGRLPPTVSIDKIFYDIVPEGVAKVQRVIGNSQYIGYGLGISSAFSAASPSHKRIVMPMTSYPFRFSSAAVTELSTPPLMATATRFCMVYSPLFARRGSAASAVSARQYSGRRPFAPGAAASVPHSSQSFLY